MARTEAYDAIHRDITAALDGETDPIVWMSTLSCLIKQRLDFYWVGFYRLVGNQLLVGPYQGTLACIRIPLHKGVCGACATRKETMVVPDVHLFAGHIACDPLSRSEIVVPVVDREGKLRCVLDVDSDKLNHFGDEDRNGLERLVGEMKRLNWTSET